MKTRVGPYEISTMWVSRGVASVLETMVFRDGVSGGNRHPKTAFGIEQGTANHQHMVQVVERLVRMSGVAT